MIDLPGFDILKAIKEAEKAVQAPDPAPDDGSRCPYCVCDQMHPEMRAKYGGCYPCKLWQRADYREKWKDKPRPAPATAPPKPSFAQKAVNFVWAVVRHAANGFERVSDEQLAERLAICGGCANKVGDTCQRCGCGLGVKATWKSEGCPEGKWPSPAP